MALLPDSGCSPGGCLLALSVVYILKCDGCGCRSEVLLVAILRTFWIFCWRLSFHLSHLYFFLLNMDGRKHEMSSSVCILHYFRAVFIHFEGMSNCPQQFFGIFCTGHHAVMNISSRPAYQHRYAIVGHAALGRPL